MEANPTSANPIAEVPLAEIDPRLRKQVDQLQKKEVRELRRLPAPGQLQEDFDQAYQASPKSHRPDSPITGFSDLLKRFGNGTDQRIALDCRNRRQERPDAHASERRPVSVLLLQR